MLIAVPFLLSQFLFWCVLSSSSSPLRDLSILCWSFFYFFSLLSSHHPVHHFLLPSLRFLLQSLPFLTSISSCTTPRYAPPLHPLPLRLSSSPLSIYPTPLIVHPHECRQPLSLTLPTLLYMYFARVRGHPRVFASMTLEHAERARTSGWIVYSAHPVSVCVCQTGRRI